MEIKICKEPYFSEYSFNKIAIVSGEKNLTKLYTENYIFFIWEQQHIFLKCLLVFDPTLNTLFKVIVVCI